MAAWQVGSFYGVQAHMSLLAHRQEGAAELQDATTLCKRAHGTPTGSIPWVSIGGGGGCHELAVSGRKAPNLYLQRMQTAVEQQTTRVQLHGNGADVLSPANDPLLVGKQLSLTSGMPRPSPWSSLREHSRRQAERVSHQTARPTPPPCSM